MALTVLSLAVVGVAHLNADGSNRRTYIMLCSPGDRVELVPEPKNPADPYAIAVLSDRGGQLGYLTAERAPYIGGILRAGREVRAIFQDTATWGCTIRVALDGSDPVLPAHRVLADELEQEAQLMDHDGFWPDPESPSDFE